VVPRFGARERGALVLIGVSAVLAGCGASEPTPEMSRAATLVLGQSVAEGTKRLGECLKAAD